jgi:recombination protein RecT
LSNQSKNNVAVKTSSERFMNNIQTQFAAEVGSPIAFSDYERALAQHMFLKLDSVLQELEAKRLKDGKDKITPYNWHNVNMRKLSLDAVHTVQLGLDALIPNHIHPVPYFNGKEKKYDLDLRVGYVGKAYYRMEAAVEKPKDIVIELVYSSDVFKPMKKSFRNEIESYEFEITNPFDRGNIIGGFGYLVYEDQSKNKLITVSEKDFENSRKAAQSDKFWSKHPEKMRYKTLVHRVTENLQIDPKKVNASYLHVESKDSEEEVRREVSENANKEIIDVEFEEQSDDSEPAEYVDIEQNETSKKEHEPEPISSGGPGF